MFQKYYHGESIAVNVLDIWSSLREYSNEHFMFQKYYHGESIAVNVLDIWSSLREYYNEHFMFQKYYHGESIAVNVLVDNNTSKTVKKVKLSG